ncbi:hypothetical protein DPMN_037575 [Dreissena polymorpha]|uniref:Uncharacterized protein n=1 Tax=Dreissena polymorpha TaxID=45954 RepID=A0A9D4RPB0_DREPO|nr:hypothetical protein DPMN_037575 [Dreissena polymorpha]
MAATPSDPNSLWIQHYSGHFAPFILILDVYEIPTSGIPTSVSVGYMQTTGLADGLAEVGSDSNIEAEFYYWASINQVCELILLKIC